MPNQRDRRETSAKRATKVLKSRTLVLAAVLGIATFAALLCRLYYLQIIRHEAVSYTHLDVYKRQILDEASTLELFDGVRQDVEFLALGSYFAELTELLTAEDVPLSLIHI